MIVFKDKLTGDEIVSDTFVLKKSDTPGLIEVDCKTVTVTSGDFQLEGANPSAEEAEEGTESTSERKLDIEDQFRLQQIPRPDKKTAQGVYKAYLKALSKHIKETEGEEKAAEFQKAAPAALKKVMGSWDDYDVFIGESMSEPAMWVLVNYREDGVTPYATIWEHGLQETKY